MYIVNQDEDLIVKVKKIYKKYDYDDSIKEHIKNIYNSTMSKVYTYTCKNNCENYTNRCIDNYLLDKKKDICNIYINDIIFGTYEIELGNKIFDMILSYIENSNNLINLKSIENLLKKEG